jgi:DNA polymerase III delta subunit
VTIFLHGSDSYRRTQRLIEAVRQFLSKYPGSGIRRFDAETDADAADKVSEVLSSTSLFSPRTLVVLSGALELTPGQVKALVNRTASSERDHLILVADTDKPAKTYARVTEEDVKQESFPKLAGESWLAFVAREAQARGCQLTRTEVQRLASALAGDSWAVATELDVLAATPEAFRTERLESTVAAAPSGGVPSWGEFRKLGSGDPARRLATLAHLEASGDAAAKIFAMASYSANPVAAARGDAAVKTGGWDFEEALVALAVY